MIKNLSASNSIFNHFIAELRDEKIQKDSMRFRKNLERIGEVVAYELSKTLDYEVKDVNTVLGQASHNLLSDQPVLATILRAGLPLHQGILNYFDRAENAFVSAYRKHKKGSDDFDIKVEYLSAPSVEGRTLIIADPMLATGSSMVLVYKALLQRGTPKAIHVVTAIASVEGVEFVKKNLPVGTAIWCGAIDDELTAQAYIVPGLGDAGDLAYGKKSVDDLADMEE
jgi:uracil phosphoribosyltransferase